LDRSSGHKRGLAQSKNNLITQDVDLKCVKRFTFSCALLSRFWTFLAKIPVFISAMAADTATG
jgi:hypothetical protein